MVKSFLLDTNAYHLFFSMGSQDKKTKLESLLMKGGVVEFYLSEISAMEIYSVLGKDRRGIQQQVQLCTRNINSGYCEQEWSTPGRKGIKNKMFKSLIKLVSDSLNASGGIRAKVISLDSEHISVAKDFLIDYADKYNFGSQDALIAATAILYKKRTETEITVVTSDKGLKAALSQAKIPVHDPLLA
ncbi:PIN domain-containing protein [Tumebacillus sp. ITR2]|uniref:PIN domain-containing protein n=1 Tax=Tumebacillus amylolyticus TaxID=2801339 RepID=A0ABS1J9D3_9BACL|nr:PIN domain-containing protein [Tumebacillus amylolyticus]MBL0386864.1 PIN domain-containing protein [Tumebacillus amylolyticus]